MILDYRVYISVFVVGMIVHLSAGAIIHRADLDGLYWRMERVAVGLMLAPIPFAFLDWLWS